MTDEERLRAEAEAEAEAKAEANKVKIRMLVDQQYEGKTIACGSVISVAADVAVQWVNGGVADNHSDAIEYAEEQSDLAEWRAGHVEGQPYPTFKQWRKAKKQSAKKE
jgi:hypothetical protein